MARLAAAFLALSSLLACLLPTVTATAAPGTVAFNFEKRRISAKDAPHLARRQSKSLSVNLDNEILLYFINVTVGTPGQPFSLQLDTGSSDIWFPSSKADICQQSSQLCPFGTYRSGSSSTFQQLDLPDFQIRYVDGTQITGTYLSDVLNVGNTKITNMTMAQALRANTRGIGIMGIGFQENESSAQTAGFTYPTIVDMMVTQGIINSRAYSLWLDDLQSNTGSILFGGVDTNKYHGNLVALPIQIDTRSGSITSFTVAWTGLTLSGSGQNSDLSPSSAQPAILDSGTTDTLLPDDIANAIFNGVGVTSDPDYGNVVPCSLANDDLTFSFTFGGNNGPMINVSLSEFVIPLITQDGSQPKFRNGQQACSFAIEAAGSNPILFGDSFLRSAYVVYDLDNQEIGLAQTNFDASGQSVKVFSSISAAIPGVSSTATAASVAQTFSGNPFITAPTASGTGGQLTGTARTATFTLSATGSGSSSSSTTTNAASSNLRPSPLEGAGFVAGVVVLVGFLFGGGMMFL